MRDLGPIPRMFEYKAITLDSQSTREVIAW